MFIKIIMTCITSTSYVIMLNGIPTPIFRAKRGLRQEDPLSPLLFVIGMEQLSRIQRSVEGTFHFHPKCKTIKHSHLCLADDLMLFCKGHVSSIRSLCHCLHLFSQTSGLQGNSAKSAIYTTGVPNVIIAELKDLSQFTYGSLPLKYLGVLLSSKRLSMVDCEQITDKMTWRIRAQSVKHLSYAARLQLINSVLMGISTYWCQMFILACCVIHIVNFICHSFLWFDIHDSHKTCHVNWDVVCKPKKAGGLGIQNLQVWNAAAVGKITQSPSRLNGFMVSIQREADGKSSMHLPQLARH